MTTDRRGAPPVIAGFTHVRGLGAGGYSTVYLYEQHMPRREVAVKVTNVDVAGRATSGFEHEANLMAKVSTHPAILSIYGAGVAADGRPFLVMEYCPPPSLETVLRRGTLSVQNALSTAIQIAGAVETAHRAGIIHRDIKPANILFTTYRRPVLADFGISAMSVPDGDQELRGMSVPWAPPEQLVGGRTARPTSDVYSLGATTYAMLTGRSPFEPRDGRNLDIYELSRRIVNEPLTPLTRQDAPPSLQRVLSIAMDKRPENRYGSALAFARALQQVEAELDLPITTVDLLQEAGTEPSEEEQGEDGSATRLGVFNRVEQPVVGAGGPQVSSRTITALDDDEDEEEESPWNRRARRGRTVLAVVATIVTAALVGGAILLARDKDITRPSPTFATISPGTIDPLTSQADPPRNLAGELGQDGAVTFTWEAPADDWEGSYLYREIVPGQETKLETTKTTEVTLSARSGRTCIEVYGVRDDGKSSAAVTACVDTP